MQIHIFWYDLNLLSRLLYLVDILSVIGEEVYLTKNTFLPPNKAVRLLCETIHLKGTSLTIFSLSDSQVILSLSAISITGIMIK